MASIASPTRAKHVLVTAAAGALSLALLLVPPVIEPPEAAMAAMAVRTPVLPPFGEAALPGEAQPGPVSGEEAQRLNAARPIAIGVYPPARPFSMKAGEADFERALSCLASAVYYEAAQEPLEGRQAVAQVVLNRVRHPAFPTTICGVVFQGWERSTGCQFTFTCDGARNRAPSPAGWRQARAVALAALRGHVASQVGWSTHYHADYVLPHWAPHLLKTSTIGRHIFYRWPRGWADPSLFRRAYRGGEVPPAVEAAAAASPSAESPEASAAPVPSSGAPAAQPAPLADAAVSRLLADERLASLKVGSGRLRADIARRKGELGDATASRCPAPIGASQPPAGATATALHPDGARSPC